MSVSIAQFLAAVASARAWAAYQAPSAWRERNYRTSELQPPYDYNAIFSPGEFRRSIAIATEFIASVIANRADLVLASSRVTSLEPSDVASGRLLRHNLGETTCTAVPKILTDGFFDSYDIPAWDTWIAFVHDIEFGSNSSVDYLVSWIPPQLVEQVDEAVRTSFEENLLWLDKTNTQFTQSLPEEWMRHLK